MKSRNGLKMVKSKNSKDEMKLKILKEELNNFSNLIDGHRKLLMAIGKSLTRPQKAQKNSHSSQKMQLKLAKLSC